MKMRLLLFGCTGFIGQELVSRLLKQGHQLTLVSRKMKPRQVASTNHNNLTRVILDSSEARSWEQENLLNSLNEAQGVINLAGEPIAEKRWNKNHCKKITNSRLNTTRFLINAMKKMRNKPKVLINGSAIGYYGTSQNEFFNEDSNCGYDFLANLCKEWEKIADEKPNKTRLLKLRIGIVLGPNGGALGRMVPIFKAGIGGPIGNGKQWMSWIHRTDICRIIENALMDSSWSGVINAVAPQPMQMSDFANNLGICLGRPSLLSVPGPILKLLLGDGAKVVLEGQHVSSKRLTNLGFKFNYPDLNQALFSATKKYQ